MDKNINLCKFLKGHEGEIFYNPLYGMITLNYIDDNYIVFRFDDTGEEIFLDIDGNSTETGEAAVFPSKKQRDWNKWVKENII